MKNTLGLAAALCVVAVIAGCSADDKSAEQPAEGGPMRIGGDEGEVCLPMKDAPGRDFTYALDVLSNDGDQQVEVVDIRAINAQRIQIAEAYVVKLQVPSLIGVTNTWPSDIATDPEHVDAWNKRQPLTGYTLPPTSDIAPHNLVVHLVHDEGAQLASLDRLQVDYRLADKTYRASTTTKIVIKPSCV